MELFVFPSGALLLQGTLSCSLDLSFIGWTAAFDKTEFALNYGN